MSTILYSDDEISALYQLLRPAAVAASAKSDDRLKTAVYALALANRCAYAMSYSDDDLAALSFIVNLGAEPAVFPVPEWNAEDRVKHYAYNCVSNGGRDFLPVDDYDFLVSLARAVDSRAA